MDEAPRPQNPVAALAAFVRHQLGNLVELSEVLPIRRPGRAGDLAPRTRSAELERGGPRSAREVALVIVGAAAPFAPTPHARARLIRQMHASGLLSEREAGQAVEVIGVAR